MIYTVERIPESRIGVFVAVTVKCTEASGKYKYISSYAEPSPGLFGYVDLHIEYEEIADYAKNLKWRHPLGAFASGIKKKTNEYTFRGKVNIYKLMLDCLIDNRVGFVVLVPGRQYFWFGVNKAVLKYFLLPDIFKHEFNSYAFLISYPQMSRVSVAIKYLKEAQKMWAELPEKLSKEIRKDNRKKDKAGIKRETVKVKVF